MVNTTWELMGFISPATLLFLEICPPSRNQKPLQLCIDGIFKGNVLVNRGVYTQRGPVMRNVYPCLDVIVLLHANWHTCYYHWYRSVLCFVKSYRVLFFLMRLWSAFIFTSDNRDMLHHYIDGLLSVFLDCIYKYARLVHWVTHEIVFLLQISAIWLKWHKQITYHVFVPNYSSVASIREYSLKPMKCFR